MLYGSGRKGWCIGLLPSLSISHRYTHFITRPSISRTNELQDEVARLSRVVKDLQSSLDDRQLRIQDVNQESIVQSDAVQIETSTKGSYEAQPMIEAGDTLVADPNILASSQTHSASGSHEPRYHGPTSAMFDGEPVAEKKTICSHSAINSSQKTQLLAEAAKQRMFLCFFLF